MNSSDLLRGTTRVQVLSDVPGPSLEARLMGREERALYLQCRSSAPVGAPVRIEVTGGCVLGEIAACEAVDGQRLLSVRIDQVIPSVPDIAQLMEGLVRATESRPAPVRGPGTLRGCRSSRC